jgi:hypothetical protein
LVDSVADLITGLLIVSLNDWIAGRLINLEDVETKWLNGWMSGHLPD